MIYNTKNILQGWDRTFLYFSSLMAEPACQAHKLIRYRLFGPLDPQKFENYSPLIKEVAFRFFAGAAAIAAAPVLIAPITVLGLGSRLLRGVGYALQKGGYTHVRGEAPEKKLNGQLKAMTWNVCGLSGGLHFDHGGLIDWKLRLDAIVEKIKKEDPDVLILQEIYDNLLAEALIEKLKDRYAHFFIHLGPNTLGNGDDCIVLSKCAVHQFSHKPFTNNQWNLSRGFATLEVKRNPKDKKACARIIGTHLIHDCPDKRFTQFNHIAKSISNFKIPTFITGDLNIERDTEGKFLNASLRHSYKSNAPTCTNRLQRQWVTENKDPEQNIDYFSQFKKSPRIKMQHCHLVRAFDKTYNTKKAISDHHGLAVTLKI